MRITKSRCITFVTLTLLSTLFIFHSCKHEGIPADQLPPVPFSKVQVIFTSYCIDCHGETDNETSYIFTDYTNIRNSVKPFNAAKSKPYKAMISTFQLMPPDRFMPSSDKTLIRIWIDQGANP